MFKTTMLLSVITLLLFSVPTVFARPAHRFDTTTNSCRDLSKGKLEWDSRVWGIGGQVFKSKCKTCHHRNNDKGATFLWVESKTSKGWNRIFSKGNVECAQNGSWASMTMTERLKVSDFLFRFGYGSADTNDNI